MFYARFLIMFSLFFGLACQSSDMTVSNYDVPKKQQAIQPAKKASLTWETPSTWRQVASSGMRLASFVAPAASGVESADVSLVSLAGDAGGELANVNRWRGQIGLPAQSAVEIQKLARKITTQNGDFVWYEITQKNYTSKAAPVFSPSIYAAILPRQDETIFVKMVGPLATLENNAEEFVALCKSIH